MTDQANILPDSFTYIGEGGNDFDVVLELDFDASADTHIVLLALKPDGEAFLVLTAGDGLTITTVDAKTSISFQISKEITFAHRKGSFYMSYQWATTNSTRTLAIAQFSCTCGIYAPTP